MNLGSLAILMASALYYSRGEGFFFATFVLRKVHRTRCRFDNCIHFFLFLVCSTHPGNLSMLRPESLLGLNIEDAALQTLSHPTTPAGDPPESPSSIPIWDRARG